ncbi:sensor histidine kinase [Candidatus Gastranaerophilus sp. (ex Termes propinquus)]|nr:sensor histidine kinase [Candidatus Gastranaerophilus sp. (ex Termes propinquus)]
MEEKRMKNVLKQYHDGEYSQNPQLLRIKLPYARVLVVDDMPGNLKLAKMLMRPYGMQIDCVTSAQQAIDAIRDEHVKYNAIFMDYMMPRINGVEALRIIREEIGTQYAKTIPIIAFTASAVAGSREMFLNKGFQAFLPKPVDTIRLDTIIRKWVRDEKQERQFYP